MRERPIHDYIWIGTAVRFLVDCDAGHPLLGPGHILANIESLIEGLEDAGLFVTLRAARQRVVPLQIELEQFAADENDAALEGGHARELREVMRDLRTVLDAEAPGLKAFVVSDKRYDVERLLSNVEQLFAVGALDDVPLIAVEDFRDCGRCIAFELSTAAAFHALRGTESVLRDFYLRIVKRGRVETLLWGPIVKHLRERRDAPSAELLDNLDLIRRSFRNPTTHPEKSYDIDEAQDLFGLCIDVVNRMARDLRTRSTPTLSD